MNKNITIVICFIAFSAAVSIACYITKDSSPLVAFIFFFFFLYLWIIG
jgi:hypothetical protein